MNRIPVLFISLLFFQWVSAQQDFYPHSFVSGSFDVVPHKEMTDSGGTYNMRSLRLRCNFPFYSRLTGNSPDTFRYLQFGATGSFSWTKPEISYILNRHNLLDVSAGLQGIYLMLPKNFLIGQFNVSFAEDAYQLDDIIFRYSGILLYHHNYSEKTGFNAGVAYTYAFGSGYLLPVLGFSSKFNDKTLLNVNLPLSISLRYKPDQPTSISFYFRPNGFLYHYSARAFNNTPADLEYVKFRKKEFQGGISLFYDAPARISFQVKTGIYFGREINFFYGDQTYMKTGLQPSVFLSMNVIYKLKKTKKETKFQAWRRNLIEEMTEDIIPGGF